MIGYITCDSHRDNFEYPKEIKEKVKNIDSLTENVGLCNGNCDSSVDIVFWEIQLKVSHNSNEVKLEKNCLIDKNQKTCERKDGKVVFKIEIPELNDVKEFFERVIGKIKSALFADPDFIKVIDKTDEIIFSESCFNRDPISIVALINFLYGYSLAFNIRLSINGN